ncbi:rCG39011 [Rattus norvegicus]|uniref:RCG39011 n=1 Tax=Rattus norvegicus TaxID=10116 RepID=A6JY83_RAT|nr:rCG39011 [Rattus norvegicus]
MESSLNGPNELLRPELTGQRKQGQEARKACTGSLPATPPQAKLPVGSLGAVEWMGQEASQRRGRTGEAPYWGKCGKEGISHFVLIFNHHSNPPPVN